MKPSTQASGSHAPGCEAGQLLSADHTGVPAFVFLTMAYSVLICWVYVQTGESVLIATLFHGAINLSQDFFLGGVEPVREYWLLAVVYGAAALAVAGEFASNLSRKRLVRAGRPRVQIEEV